MNREDLTARIRVRISKTLDRPLADIQPTTAFHDDLRLDDLDWIEMLLALEGEFDVEIHDDDAERCKTVGNLIDHLAERLGLVEAVTA